MSTPAFEAGLEASYIAIPSSMIDAYAPAGNSGIGCQRRAAAGGPEGAAWLSIRLAPVGTDKRTQNTIAKGTTAARGCVPILRSTLTQY